MAFYFVSTLATAQTPTKQRPYGYRGLPALAFALHGWQREFVAVRMKRPKPVAGPQLELWDATEYDYYLLCDHPPVSE